MLLLCLVISLIKTRFFSKFSDRYNLLSILRNWKQSDSSTEIPLTHPFLWIRDTIPSQRVIHPEKIKDTMPVVMRDWVHCLVEWCKESDSEVVVGNNRNDRNDRNDRDLVGTSIIIITFITTFIT